jgi:hypothetical protein
MSQADRRSAWTGNRGSVDGVSPLVESNGAPWMVSLQFAF